MTQNEDSYHNLPVDGDCPYCDESRDFDTDGAAYVWLVGHVHEAHTDKRPTRDL